MPGTAIVQIGLKQWNVQVATTPAELTQGLSGVPSMSAYNGMLFDMGTGPEAVINVTMEDMLFPLSIVFFGNDLKVTEVALISSPGETGLHTMYPARFFMEVNLGELGDVEIGDTVIITGYVPPEQFTISSLISLMVSMMVVVMMMKMMMQSMKQLS